jgi:glycosyltransferase involved in cell wall biosynthesis
MVIAVPSKGRIQNSTSEIFPSAKLFVPKSEFYEYSEVNSNEVIPVPDKISGITQTRNWIIDYLDGEDIVFIDDDIREIGCFIDGERIDLKSNSKCLIDEFKKIFEICRGLEVKLFGVEAGGSKMANHPLQPFSMRGVINATCMGLVAKSGLYFDERFKVKEDYELMLREYKRTGMALKAKYFYIRTHHWSNQGGCVDYRTDKMEEDAIELLEKRYPFMIKRGTRKNKYQLSISWD